MFYYTYLIYVNDPKSSLCGCIYYGQHRTNNLLDGYICSGKILSKKWLKNHPDGYYRKILQLYNSDEELNRAEYELIRPHLGQSYCLNLIDGGHGGKVILSKEAENQKAIKCRNAMFKNWNNNIDRKQKLSERMKKQTPYIRTEEVINKISQGLKLYYATHEYTEAERNRRSITAKGKNNPMYGKNSEDYMSPEAVIEKRKKQSNSMKGRRHMTNGITLKYVKPEEIDYYLSNGYHIK